MGIHKPEFTYQTAVTCTCHPGFIGRGENKRTALEDLEAQIDAASGKETRAQQAS